MYSTLHLFIENDRQLQEYFKWNNNLIRKYGALELALHNNLVNEKKIHHTMLQIKNNTSSFSNFRGANLFPLSLLLSIYNDKQECIHESIKIYNQLKKIGFKRSTYLPYVAVFLAASIPPYDIKETINRSILLYKKMKKSHRFITSDNDYLLIALLASKYTNNSTILKETEQIYQTLLKHGQQRSNTTKTMSLILALNDEQIETKVQDLLLYEEKLKKQNIQIKGHSRIIISLLPLIHTNIDSTVSQIHTLDAELQKVKGFQNFTLGKSNRNLFSTAIVTAAHLNCNNNTAVSSAIFASVQSLLLAQQAAIFIAVTAAAAAAVATA